MKLKFILILPVAILIAICGIACAVVGLTRLEDWLAEKYDLITQ